MNTTYQTNNPIKYIHVIIILLFMFGFQFLPPIGNITPIGMRALGILLGIIYGWSTMDMIWPSLLGLFALSLLPNTGAIETFKTGFGDRITVAIFFFLIFGELISKVGLSKYIADWCVSRKFVRGKPYGILAMFCLAGAFIAAFVNNFASMIIMWGVFYSFCHEANIKPGNSYARYSLIAIIFVCTMSGDIMPFMGFGLMLSSMQEQMLGLSLPYIPFTIMQIIMVGLAGTFYILFIKFIIKPDTKIVENYTPDEKQLKMTNQQKFVLTLLISLLVILFLPGLLPQEYLLTQILKALDLAGMVALVLSIYFIVNLNNASAIPFHEMGKGINWSLIFMFATVAPLSNALTSEESGVMQTITALLNNLISDMNPMLFTILIFFLASILTQFCNNVAILLITVPIMYTFAVQLGANPIMISILAAFNLNVAFCTPAASGPAGMVFSNHDWIGKKVALTNGLVIFVINMVVTIIGMFITNLII